MTPESLAAHLRSIASRIEASGSPSRSRVASELRRVLAAMRTADRTSVLNAVDQAFTAVGAYPPVMRASGSGYAGQVDDGWDLYVQEDAGGKVVVDLNGKRCKDVVSAAKAYKAKDPAYQAGAGAASPGGKTQAEWEMQFYKSSGPLPPDQIGSHMFWAAFSELGWHDWTPASSPDEAEAKIREMYKTHGYKGDVEESVREMRKNYEDYKHYEPSYIDGTIHD